MVCRYRDFLKANMKNLLAAALCALPLHAVSDDIDAGDFIGYTIAAKMTITGWQDTSGEKTKGDSFEGCTYGRKIIFDNRLALTCTTYSYSYSYRPTAILLVKDGSIVMVVNGNSYSMSK